MQTTEHVLRTLAHRKGIELGRFIFIIVFLLPALILGFLLAAGTLNIGTEGVPVAKKLLMAILCAIGFA